MGDVLLEVNVRTKVKKLKAEMLAMIQEVEVNDRSLNGFEGVLSDPVFGDDRVSKKIGRNESGNWVTKSGRIVDFRLHKINFSVLTTSHRFDLRFGTYWAYDVQWDDGVLERDVAESSLSKA